MSTPLEHHLTHLRSLVESDLRDRLQRLTSAPARLVEAMRYSLLGGGKRLRPLLVMLAAEAVGGDTQSALPAASAIEMVHTYSLVHDDLPAMDDDDWRRGQPTCHKRFDSEALAILAGDALLTLAVETLAESYPPSTATVSCLELARGAGAIGMVGGQVLDLAAEGQMPGMEPPTSLEGLEGIHRQKTGALFRAAVRMGAAIAGGDEQALDRMDTFGRAFGLAFQITDDLLDVESSQEKTGKGVGKDAVRGKLTYPGLLGVAESRRRAEEQLRLAVEAVAGFGPAGEPLAYLARMLLERDH